METYYTKKEFKDMESKYLKLLKVKDAEIKRLKEKISKHVTTETPSNED